MSKTVLITGGSGLIGKPLTETLQEKGYQVSHLSRGGKAISGVNVFKWNVYEGTIDEKSIEGVDHIIHLAGEGIADKLWTQKRKKQIIESRTESIRLIYKLLGSKPNSVKSIISSSGVGFYGDRKDEVLLEDSLPGTDFLAESCIEWEKAVDEGRKSVPRIVKLRTGVVLSKDGGALPKIAKPVKFGFGAALGSGEQWMPWIHIADIVKMYVYAMENEELEGAFNAAAPAPVTNIEFTEAIAKQLKKPLFLPSVPSFALRMALGEMSAVVLNSTKTSSAKIASYGFTFEYEDVRLALKNIYE